MYSMKEALLEIPFEIFLDRIECYISQVETFIKAVKRVEKLRAFKGRP